MDMISARSDREEKVMRTNRCKGFTLIELLIVITIIGIIASILFPVFSRARENARKISCLSNLKSIGLALMQYTQDNDERYFARNTNWTTTAEEATGVDNTWLQPYQTYIKSMQVVKCPSAKGETLSRAVNYNCNLVVLSSLGPGGTAYSNISVPMYIWDSSHTAVAMDGKGQDNWSDAGYSIDSMGAEGEKYDTCRYYCVGARHLEGFNVLYLDGHAKWKNLKKVYLRDNGASVIPSYTIDYYGPASWAVCEPIAYANLSPSMWYTRP